MVQRISIALSDELFERLQGVKDEFNISGVCQDAIESEIIRQEIFKKGVSNMEDVIKRLKDEKKQSQKKDRDNGFNDGYEEAKTMSYFDLKSVMDSIPEHGPDNIAILQGLPLWEEGLKDCVTGKCREGEITDTDKYLYGWIEGVWKFWEEVENKI